MRIRIQAVRLAGGLVISLLAVAPAFAAHVHEVELGQAVTINGTQLAPGKYKVSWETNSPQATVTFKHKKTTIVTTTGTLEQRPSATEYDTVVYAVDDSGQNTILELRFAGSNKVLSFGQTSTTGSLTAPDTDSEGEGNSQSGRAGRHRKHSRASGQSEIRPLDLGLIMGAFGSLNPASGNIAANTLSAGRKVLVR